MTKNITSELKELVVEAVSTIYPDKRLMPGDISLEHPGVEEHGDYSTNIALVLSKKVGKGSLEIAKEIVGIIMQSAVSGQGSVGEIIEKVEVAGPGFVNFFLKESIFIDKVGEIIQDEDKFGHGEGLAGKKLMVEYAHPNTHKEMHIGHMRTLITGEALARILESQGGKVFRANYQGDIGQHVAKAIWGIRKLLAEKNLSREEAEKLSLKDKAHLLGLGYVQGIKDYAESKDQIDVLNKDLYQQVGEVWPEYERTRRWSLEYYDMFYQRFYTKFDRLYFESEVAQPGKKIVLENVGQIFEESEGAIIFPGEKYDLHTRVFVTKDGNPTYEAKEMALGPLEFADFAFDHCIHVVANEQAGYFQVVFKSLELIDNKFKNREYHLSMGMVNLVGRKISSRTGVIITVDGLIDDVKDLLKPVLQSRDLPEVDKESILEAATIGAVKYSVLKGGPLQNVSFDLEKSVSLDGDSGPYLQYSYARARSVLRKSGDPKLISVLINSGKPINQSPINQLTPEEMSLLRYLYRFPEVVEAAARTYSPNLICSYLFDLAKRFNNLYNNIQILGVPEESFRIELTEASSVVLKNGLNLLGIHALEKM